MEELWTRYLAGEQLARHEWRELTTAVTQDDVLHRRLLHDLQVHGALLAAAEIESDAGAAERPSLPAQGRKDWSAGRRRWVAAGAGALALVAAGTLALTWSPAPSSNTQVEVIKGRAYLHGRDGSSRAMTRTKLDGGDWLSTHGEASRVKVTVPGVTVQLEGETVSAPLVSGRGFLLARGKLTAMVASSDAARSPPWAIVSPHARILVDGRVRLEVSGGSTRVEVQEGRARVEPVGSGPAEEVQAGQTVTARLDEAMRPAASSGSRLALLLVGSDHADDERAADILECDRCLQHRLERLGFEVKVLRAQEVREQDLRGVSVVVVSAVLAADGLGGRLGELPVPVVAIEPSSYAALGLTGDLSLHDASRSAAIDRIVIERPEHPLAAELAGSVRVLSRPAALSWGRPGPGAVIIARGEGADPEGAVLFAYDRGALMARAAAPARRVALFLGERRAIKALTERGWRLFAAAIDWAVGDDP